MLAVLRVAPLLPSPTLRAVARGSRSGRESRLIDRTGKLSLDVTELNHPSISACDVFLLRPPM